MTLNDKNEDVIHSPFGGMERPPRGPKMPNWHDTLFKQSGELVDLMEKIATLDFSEVHVVVQGSATTPYPFRESRARNQPMPSRFTIFVAPGVTLKVSADSMRFYQIFFSSEKQALAEVEFDVQPGVVEGHSERSSYRIWATPVGISESALVEIDFDQDRRLAESISVDNDTGTKRHDGDGESLTKSTFIRSGLCTEEIPQEKSSQVKLIGDVHTALKNLIELLGQMPPSAVPDKRSFPTKAVKVVEEPRVFPKTDGTRVRRGEELFEQYLLSLPPHIQVTIRDNREVIIEVLLRDDDRYQAKLQENRQMASEASKKANSKEPPQE